MSYALAEAAAACGLDKSTVRRAVRKGRISGTHDELGVWHVEASELHRVFPPAARPTPRRTPRRRRGTPQPTLRPTPWSASSATVIDDLQRDRDAWRDQAQRLALPAPVRP